MDAARLRSEAPARLTQLRRFMWRVGANLLVLSALSGAYAPRIIAQEAPAGFDEYIKAIGAAIARHDLAAVQRAQQLAPQLFHEAIRTRPLLHYSVAVGDVNITRFILDQGADVNARISGGETPLDGAVYFCDSRLIELLVRSGADSASRVRAWINASAAKQVWQERNVPSLQRTWMGITRTVTLDDVFLAWSTVIRLGIGVTG